MIVITFRLFGGWNNRGPHSIVKMLTGRKDLAGVPKFWASIFLSGSFWRTVRRLGKLLRESFVWHPTPSGRPFSCKPFSGSRPKAVFLSSGLWGGPRLCIEEL